MGASLMAGDIDDLSRLIGGIEQQLKTLFKKLEDLEETSTREHRVVHDIVEATSDAVRTLTAMVNEMKPLTDDYREKRAEARGAQKMVHLLYVSFGGIAGALTTWAMSLLSNKPHP
jgi:hypothetical protein